MEQLIDSTALAIALSVTVTTVQRYTREKKIPSVQVGSLTRYRLSEVMRALDPKAPRLSLFNERGVPFGTEAYAQSVEDAVVFLQGMGTWRKFSLSSHALKTQFEQSGHGYICNDAMAEAVMRMPEDLWRFDGSRLDTRFKGVAL